MIKQMLEWTFNTIEKKPTFCKKEQKIFLAHMRGHDHVANETNICKKSVYA